MPYLDLNSATASNTGTTTFSALAAVSGDTLTVRSLGQNNDARLVGLGCKHATAGSVRLRSPFLHDDTNAIRSRTLAADGSSVIDELSLQTLRGQDPLILEATGGSSAEQVSAWMQIYYPTLQGGPSLYIGEAELRSRAMEYVTVEVAVTGGSTATWGTGLVSGGTGILKADQVYAVVGYELDVACTAVAIQGPDTGNFKAGGPGITTRQFTRRYFWDLAWATGLPLIPCFNAQNASGTSVYVVDSAGATAVNVDLICVRLKK
jgi:hypothetical protein